ncbi:hypothetical protein DAPPUDRAFT_235696 [Daphnia pulex]|uniref:Protein kinase domain-containing protein n=1 Tax=Daphnia pulex TaxID=6669 RepID=E9G0K4_DAPPU|nr:hypothetical protein DAPPUDRAFT_235696 [Daphnia pulex]|eukprot:EFX87386.1 hypothetical protein DAPPUDRAFT_235696 [Daphnia pulex]
MIQPEVETLSAVQHRNFIGLLGLCMDNESSDGEASIRVSLIFQFANSVRLSFRWPSKKQQIQIRRESNDADRSPSHREPLHLLHSTQQKPGVSVMVHCDVKSANVLLQRGLVWHVFIRISTKVAPALALA